MEWNQLLLAEIEDLEIVGRAIRRMADNAKRTIRGE
jgi:hypothetical protein